MNSLATLVEENQRILVSGTLNFSSIVPLWEASLKLFPKYNAMEIDLANVVAVNSGGLALILEWIKYAKRSQKIIRFINIPLQLQSIAEVGGIDSLIK